LLAVGSACAGEQNKFWEYHDIAFETKGTISQPVVTEIASKIGLDLSEFTSCMNSGRGLQIVREDIDAAIQAGVKSTPTLFINGRGLRGVPKPWILSEILQYSKENLAPPE
jgi:protein-disulfide isomerase